MNSRKTRIAALLLTTGMSFTAQAAYTFTELGTLGGILSIAKGINNSGQVAGVSTNLSENEIHAVVWNGTTPTDLGLGQAYAINDHGQVVGTRYTTGTTGVYAWHATSWNGSTVHDLIPLGERDSYASAINNSGQVAGWSTTSSAYNTHAVAWNDITTTATDLAPIPNKHSYANAINESGHIAGYRSSQDGGQQTATVWNGAVEILLPFLVGGYESLAYAINDAGQVVGYSTTYSTTGGYEAHATVWENLTAIDLGTLGGNSGFALAINNSGLIAGWSLTTANNYDSKHATLWNGGTATDLNGFLDAETVSAGWVLTEATGINDNGWIIGNAYNSVTGESHAYLLTPVPEPETYAMMLAGLGLVGAAARRRRG